VPVREACIFCYTQDVSIVNGVALWLTQLPSSCCCQHLILITSLKNQRWTLDGKNTTLLEKNPYHLSSRKTIIILVTCGWQCLFHTTRNQSTPPSPKLKNDVFWHHY
jgi:hypothetical protein